MPRIRLIKTPIGILEIILTKSTIVSCVFVTNNDKYNFSRNKYLLWDIGAYFNGDSREFNLDFQFVGTPFQIKVWKEICKIPYGETLTYGEIAEKIGKPKSCRAVANACGANILALFIPCHRVVGKNNVGGYKWGLDKKQWLLDLEKENM